ncbi:hypothetical protein AUK18_00180 [Candidatus Beckwithbacteria bacterium CG2_30_44_31]|uniref:Acyltransferase 3 domain-containing protein n=1 Tax=Candidatus Beckwithbacteria bacterium CG2_30_44_31 TaxID=1805035 RepID=A0A1J5AZW2_9BACT|nr:MAG: hypothetical protein AUK18_00180 [Candidatus Beckwithbacteria bacterium CG2_30_44_31]
MAAKPYNPAIDLLRFISILAVVLIHTTTRTLEMTHYQLYQTPWTLLLHQITRFAVPLFFMISGFVLELNYDNQASYWQYLIKRLNRIFIPYVFWSAVYFYFVYTRHGPDFLSALIYGSASHQLYFIPALLVFYLIFPLFHWLYRFFARKWILLILAAVELCLLSADYYQHSLRFFYPLGVALYNFYVFILGMVVSHYHDQLIAFVKKWLAVLIPLTVFLAGYIFYSGRGLFYQTGDIGYFYSNWRPQVMLYTLVFFAVFYYFFTIIRFNLKIVKTISGLSFLVFFLHIIVLEKIWALIGTPLHPAFWYDPLFFLLTAAVSFFIAYLVHKIPYFKIINILSQ